MRGKYKYILLTFAIAILLIPQCAIAQSDAQFSQYFEVPSYYNAGAIGRSDFVHIRGGSRMQWVGIPKAPKTFIATADMPLKLFDKRFGVGLIMQQESMGLYKNMLLGAQLGYQIKLFGGTLSAGVFTTLCCWLFTSSYNYFFIFVIIVFFIIIVIFIIVVIIIIIVVIVIFIFSVSIFYFHY